MPSQLSMLTMAILPAPVMVEITERRRRSSMLATMATSAWLASSASICSAPYRVAMTGRRASRAPRELSGRPMSEVQPQLAGVEQVLGVQHALGGLQQGKGRAPRLPHVGRAQQPHAVGVAELGAVLQQHGVGRVPGCAVPLGTLVHGHLAAQRKVQAGDWWAEPARVPGMACRAATTSS